ncbi:MAG: hypothetical protein EB075_11875 [Bacteroidetes bacterium]|nr:hypothetical protein [Bacteroidota bacterium]
MRVKPVHHCRKHGVRGGVVVRSPQDNIADAIAVEIPVRHAGANSQRGRVGEVAVCEPRIGVLVGDPGADGVLLPVC